MIPDKKAQLNIILATNPAEDDLHTWVRTVDDILTFDELFRDGLYDVTPDFTVQDIQNVLNTGKVTVYSSKPIKNGNFVTPSKMEAASYSGDETIYTAEVDVSDVAWIDESQGQLATDKNVDYTRISCKGLI